MIKIGKRIKENFIKVLETYEYLIYQFQRHLYVSIKTATYYQKKETKYWRDGNNTARNY